MYLKLLQKMQMLNLKKFKGNNIENNHMNKKINKRKQNNKNKNKEKTLGDIKIKGKAN